ncbi:unnamed protein product [Closterium sp. Yama58-4]|nr:unnamed protein product [Closterium sp. Yama58-4]
MAKKSSFEKAVKDLTALVASQYPSSSPDEQQKMISAVHRAATLLKTRYTTRGFWAAGLVLFRAASAVLGEGAERNRVQQHIKSAQEFLGEEGEGGEGEEAGLARGGSEARRVGGVRGDGEREQEAGRAREVRGGGGGLLAAASPSFQFEGQLTAAVEPPRPDWLVAQTLLATLAAAQQQRDLDSLAADANNDSNSEREDRDALDGQAPHQAIAALMEGGTTLEDLLRDAIARGGADDLLTPGLAEALEASMQASQPPSAPPASKRAVKQLPVLVYSEAGVVPLEGGGTREGTAAGSGISGSSGSSSSGDKAEKGDSAGLEGEGKREEGEGSVDECSVCREKWEIGDKLREMPCSHRFHVDCLQPWLDEHNSCPLCRYEMPTDDHAYERRKEREKEEEEERRATHSTHSPFLVNAIAAAMVLPCCIAMWGCACCGWAIHRLLRTGADASRDWPTASKDEMADFPRLAALVLASYEPDLPKCLQLLESVSDEHGNISPQADAAAARKPSKLCDSGATHAQTAKKKDHNSEPGPEPNAEAQSKSEAGSESNGKDGPVKGKRELIEARVLRKVEQRETDGQCPSYLVYLDDANKDITVAMRGMNLTQLSDYEILRNNRKGKQMFDGGYVHCGLLAAAGAFLDLEMDHLKRLLRRHPSHTLTLTGHSIGAGVLALAAMVLANNLRELGRVKRGRIRCVGFSPPRCASLNLAVRHADIITSVVLQDDFLPRVAHPLALVFGLACCLPCVLQYSCCRDTCVSEQRRLADPRRLYAPGRLYHMLYTQRCSCEDLPPVALTAIPVEGRFEHVVLSRTAMRDHTLPLIAAKLHQFLQTVDEPNAEAEGKGDEHQPVVMTAPAQEDPAVLAADYKEGEEGKEEEEEEDEKQVGQSDSGRNSKGDAHNVRPESGEAGKIAAGSSSGAGGSGGKPLQAHESSAEVHKRWQDLIEALMSDEAEGARAGVAGGGEREGPSGGTLQLPKLEVMAPEPVRVLVTGAAGQIGYALVPMIARGILLGPDQPVILHLLDIPLAESSLNGVRMELIDAAFPLIHGVVATSNVEEACKGVQVAIMVGGFPRKAGMERKDVMSKNVSIYRDQASALEKFADKDCKVVVVANPANTNALILKEFAPKFPAKNITCLTRLDHNRALGQISERLGVPVANVKNTIIWGNHSSTQYPDVNHAVVVTPEGEKPVRELVKDDAWLDGDFIKTVQQRGAAIIAARKLSSALSAASSACDHIRNWVKGTPEGTWVSMGVISDGSYGVPKDIIYSFPVTCKDGEWTIVQGLSIDANSKAKMEATAAELVEEKELAYECLKA